MAFIQLASDNFNRSNANPIGGNWTGVTNNNQIVSNAVQPNGTNNAEHSSYYNQLSWPNDQYSEVSITTLTGSVQAGPCVRMATGANSMYQLNFSGATV